MRVPEVPSDHSPLINIGSKLLCETAMQDPFSNVEKTNRAMGGPGLDFETWDSRNRLKLMLPDEPSCFPAVSAPVPAPPAQRPRDVCRHQPSSARPRWSTAHPTS